jgi:hypothetical protein
MGQLHKQCTHITFDPNKISWCVLKTLQLSIHSKRDVAYLAWGISYTFKKFYKIDHRPLGPLDTNKPFFKYLPAACSCKFSALLGQMLLNFLQP